MHLFGLIVRFYHDARSHERQTIDATLQLHVDSESHCWVTMNSVLKLFPEFPLIKGSIPASLVLELRALNERCFL